MDLLGRKMVSMRVLGLVVGALFVAGVAAAGGPHAFVNETLADGAVVGVRGGNRATLKDLMGSGSNRQGGTLEECVESIRKGLLTDNSPPGLDDYRTSFPPEDFVPPGSQEWCECIVADPPTTLPSDNNAESHADWDRTFNRCRDLVLVGSDFNTVDICRGMFDFFTTDVRKYYHSFCGDLCSAGREYNYFLNYYWAPPMMDVDFTCSDECAAETMPGYCSKYALTYGGWWTFLAYRYTYTTRKIAVNGQNVGEQNAGAYGFVNKRSNAQSICAALQPLLGCYNACCNYQRGFEALQICCSGDENGKAVFDCENTFGGRNLKYDCIDSLRARDMSDWYYCQSLVRKYVASPEYGSAKLYTNGDEVVVMFPQSFIDRIDGCSGYYEIPFVANCLTDAELSYKGPTVTSLSGPLEPADCGDGPDDPCMGTCEGDRQCVVAGNGVPFCVECSALLKRDTECCSYDEEKMKCVTALKGSSIGMCKRYQNIFVIDDEGDSVRATFKNSTGFACANPRDFRRNGKACKVKKDANGVAKCFDRT